MYTIFSCFCAGFACDCDRSLFFFIVTICSAAPPDFNSMCKSIGLALKIQQRSNSNKNQRIFKSAYHRIKLNFQRCSHKVANQIRKIEIKKRRKCNNYLTICSRFVNAFSRRPKRDVLSESNFNTSRFINQILRVRVCVCACMCSRAVLLKLCDDPYRKLGCACIVCILGWNVSEVPCLFFGVLIRQNHSKSLAWKFNKKYNSLRETHFPPSAPLSLYFGLIDFEFIERLSIGNITAILADHPSSLKITNYK